MSEDNYTPVTPVFASAAHYQFFCQHRFHMADDRLRFLPKNWQQLLDGLNNGTDVATVRRGPLFRILAFRWLNPDTEPGIHSLN